MKQNTKIAIYVQLYFNNYNNYSILYFCYRKKTV